jgi:hypothetical protein
MKRYYSKIKCRIASITSFRCVERDPENKYNATYEFNCDVMADVIKANNPNGNGLHIVRFKQDDLAYDGRNELREVGEWVVSPLPLYLVERYDFAEDEIKYNIIDEPSFHKFYFQDDEPELIEMHGFEEPIRRTA